MKFTMPRPGGQDKRIISEYPGGWRDNWIISRNRPAVMKTKILPSPLVVNKCSLKYSASPHLSLRVFRGRGDGGALAAPGDARWATEHVSEPAPVEGIDGSPGQHGYPNRAGQPASEPASQVGLGPGLD